MRDWRKTRWAVTILMVLVAGWGTLAVYYSTLQPDHLRLALTAFYAVCVVFSLALLRFRLSLAVWTVLTAALVAWFIHDPPSNDRDWAPEYAVQAEPTQIGREVAIRNVRNFSWHSPTEAAPGYYDATYSLDGLTSLDLVTSFWSGDLIAHVFLTFGFSDGRHLAFSIETRRQRDAEYSSIAGFFRHYELFYVVADERDVLGVRTDVRRERVYLYRVHLPPAAREALFLSYIEKVARLNHRPEWYNTLTDNCTTGILSRAGSASLPARYNWRILVPGRAAEYAYMLGLLDDRVPFATLMQESRIVRPPDAVIGPDYSREIRKGLPME